MKPGSRASMAAGLIGIVLACSTTQEASQAPKSKSAQASSVESINAEPTTEAGVYRVPLVFQEVTQTLVAQKKLDAPERRVLEPGRWSFDASKSLITIRDPVDDSKELVILLGTRSSPPIVVLDPQADLSTIRVVVGDHLGVSGHDYVVEDKALRVRLLGPDTPESRLRYYVEYSLRADPAHPELGRTSCIGNRKDMDAVRRMLADPAGSKG